MQLLQDSLDSLKNTDKTLAVLNILENILFSKNVLMKADKGPAPLPISIVIMSSSTSTNVFGAMKNDR